MADIKYPNVQHWLHLLDPIEAVYLIIYSYATRKTEDVRKPGSYWFTKPDKILLSQTIDVDNEGQDLLEADDEEVSFEIILSTPVDKNDDSVTVTIIGENKFSFSPVIPATHYDPPEGGESSLDDIVIELITMWDPALNDDVELDNIEETDLIKRKDIKNIAMELVEGITQCDDNNVKFSPAPFPKGLEEKIESLVQVKRSRISKNLGL